MSIRGQRPWVTVMDEADPINEDSSPVLDFTKLGQLVTFRAAVPLDHEFLVGTLEHYDRVTNMVYVNVEGEEYDGFRQHGDAMPAYGTKIIPRATWTHRIAPSLVVAMVTPPKSKNLRDVERWLDS